MAPINVISGLYQCFLQEEQQLSPRHNIKSVINLIIKRL